MTDECVRCHADISHRPGPARYCEPCGRVVRRERQRVHNRTFNARHPGYHAQYQRALRAM